MYKKKKKTNILTKNTFLESNYHKRVSHTKFAKRILIINFLLKYVFIFFFCEIFS
jgi:hypothetical protein